MSNRSFLFGDGFFETIRLGKNNFCPLAPYHASRIARSASFLQFEEWEFFNEDDFHELIRTMRLPRSTRDWKLKWVFFREGGGSYAPPEKSRSGLRIICEEWNQPFFHGINQVERCETVTIFPAEWGWMKSNAALPYVLAGMERVRKKADELILTSPDFWVVEGSFTSICWEDSDGLHFCPKNLGGVDSCQRRFLEDFFRKQKIAFSEKAISYQVLMKEARWIAFLSSLGIRIFRNQVSKILIPEVFSGLPVSEYNSDF